MSSAQSTADEPVDPTDLVLRRIPDVWVVQREGLPRPSSQAFNNDGDGEPMSGFLDSAVAALALDRADVVTGHEGFHLVGLRVQGLIDEGQQVVRDPIDPPLHPCDPAHVGVVGPKADKRRGRLAAQALWVQGLCPAGAQVALPASR